MIKKAKKRAVTYRGIPIIYIDEQPEFWCRQIEFMHREGEYTLEFSSNGRFGYQGSEIGQWRYNNSKIYLQFSNGKRFTLTILRSIHGYFKAIDEQQNTIWLKPVL